MLKLNYLFYKKKLYCVIKYRYPCDYAYGMKQTNRNESTTDLWTKYGKNK